MQRFKIYLSIFSLCSLFTMGSLSAQDHCPSDIPHGEKSFSPGIPGNSHIISLAEERGNHPNSIRNSRTASHRAITRSCRVYVMEKDGECYKVANSDLGRTMKIRCEDLDLNTGTHYELRLRKLPDPAAEGEAPNEDDCNPEWEVVTGGYR